VIGEGVVGFDGDRSPRDALAHDARGLLGTREGARREAWQRRAADAGELLRDARHDQPTGDGESAIEVAPEGPRSSAGPWRMR
jgi:hypothetical protein